MGFLESQLFIGFVVLSCQCLQVSSFGSMSSIATSFGDKGNIYCVLKPDGSPTVTCNGSNSGIVHGAPPYSAFRGLTGGFDFVCGLLVNSSQPYCWGSNKYIRERMGVPQPMVKGAQYSEISAGENHLCGLRKPLWERRQRNTSIVDCWGLNMTNTFVFDVQVHSISAGCEFNCGLFFHNRTVFCWGVDSNSSVIRSIPRGLRFKMLAAGCAHVCGILERSDSGTVCWGSSSNLLINSGQHLNDLSDVLSPPNDSMVSIISGKYHACGIKSIDRRAICWGSSVPFGIPAPTWTKISEIVAGDYFTCGILSEIPHQLVCWGTYSGSLPLASPPGKCSSSSCPSGYYEMKQNMHHCNSSNPHFCSLCSYPCSHEMYQTSGCNLTSDRICAYNCSNCFSSECFSRCSSLNPGPATVDKDERLKSKQVPVVVAAHIAFAVFVFFILFATAFLYVRYNLRYCQCSASRSKMKKRNGSSSSRRENNRIRPDSGQLGIGKAKRFTYEELERATDGFKNESKVGKGSFSCVFKGVLEDGTVVAVKRAIRSSNRQRNSNDFQTELDLLSRLNHAHLLNLIGYCEESGEIILVYEFMANCSLHQHLHGQNEKLKEQLDWVRRVTIAVQAARGIEYLHGYACPPVIHRDIKSSNILIDEEHNARVADFGLSLLGPADSSTPLSELPAGTLGYLDPEYYRFHHLTTKSDVYSFGVMLLELLSGRKAIEMQCDEENIAQWAKPLIKSGDIAAILDPVLKPPPDLAALEKVAIVACKSVSTKGRDRPSMEEITTALERALAQLMGSPCSEQPILPTEVVLGSSRMQMRSSQRSSNRSEIEVAENEDKRLEFRAPSWITFPRVTSSQGKIKSSSSETEADVKDNNNAEGTNNVVDGGGDVLTSLEEEIGPASS